MRFQVRDVLWITVVIAVSLGWLVDSRRQKAHATALALRAQKAEAEETRLLESAKRDCQDWARFVESSNRERQVLTDNIRRLRGVIKMSLADKREWFELEVSGKRLVAIRSATTASSNLNVDTIENIENETGLEAQRLKHFVTPITQLRLTRQ